MLSLKPSLHVAPLAACFVLLAIPASPAPSLALASPATPHGKDKGKNVTVRWAEGQPGCTFSADPDGKYRYGLWSGNTGVILAVDAREVQIIKWRVEPILGLWLEVKVRGDGHVDFDPGTFSLRFVKHFNVVQTSLDPDDYGQKIQGDADGLDHETAREIAKHPEQKDAREKRLQEFQKSANELIEFISKRSLRPAHLERGNPDASGWVFFSTDNKWLGGWKSQEEFVLTVPFDGQTFEFPFLLPPKKGELLLRKRD